MTWPTCHGNTSRTFATGLSAREELCRTVLFMRLFEHEDSQTIRSFSWKPMPHYSNRSRLRRITRATVMTADSTQKYA
jgi:hypothetical protein